MNTDDKKQIVELRKNGMGYKKIAQVLGITDNSVKSFCRRNGLTNIIREERKNGTSDVPQKNCKQCGVLVLQNPGHREKIFCSSACRIKWWNTHLSQVKRKTMCEYTCPVCGKKYYAYGNRHRKYCSHTCYIVARYGDDKCI